MLRFRKLERFQEPIGKLEVVLSPDPHGSLYQRVLLPLGGTPASENQHEEVGAFYSWQTANFHCDHYSKQNLERNYHFRVQSKEDLCVCVHTHVHRYLVSCFLLKLSGNTL